DYTDVRTLTNFITYCDGKHDLIAIAEKIKVNALELLPTLNRLLKEGLLVKVEENNVEIE
ncbi:aminopeptidase, partial [Pseudoalteromonas ruthenica]